MTSADPRRDQAEAAAAEAKRRLEDAERPDWDQAFTTDRGSAPGYVLRLAEQAWDAPKSCIHLSDPITQPAYWLAWEPEIIRCGQCAARAALAFEADSELVAKLKATPMRCDLCHRPTGRNPTIVEFTNGPLTVRAGVCRRCRRLT